MSKHELHTLDQILALLDGGAFLAGLMEEHRDLILSLHDRLAQYGGKAEGSVSIKINYSLDHRLNLSMKASADVKKPKEPAASAIAWTSDDGHLTPENPHQMKMELRDAGGDQQIRTTG